MSFEILKRLNIACGSDEHVYMDGLNLGELYWRSKEVQEAESRFCAALRVAADAAAPKNDALQNALTEMDDSSGEMCCAHEEQGFINGFRFAMKMMTEAQQ